jgi:hypothetical protein
MAQLVDPVADGASYLAGAQRRMGALRPSVSWLVANLSAGVLAGIRTLIGATALAALIFSGELAGGLPVGIGILLFSAAAVGVVVGATSSYPGAVASPRMARPPSWGCWRSLSTQRCRQRCRTSRSWSACSSPSA